jgi:peptide-methionine (R)-S-oxide reductase
MQGQAVKSESEWRRKLTPEQYRVTRQKGTEPPYSGRYHHFNKSGIYRCICCGNDLFSSEAKFSAKSKWPAFWTPAGINSVSTATEIFHFMVRNEVTCAQCDAHLGYVFEDGRPPTGLRYFVNSAALMFIEKKECRVTSRDRRVFSDNGPARGVFRFRSSRRKQVTECSA